MFVNASHLPGHTSRHASQDLAKPVAVPNARTGRQCSKNERKLTRKMNNETLTKCICHKGLSGYSSVVARSNCRVGGQDSSQHSLTAHTLSRYHLNKKAGKTPGFFISQTNQSSSLRRHKILFQPSPPRLSINLQLCPVLHP